MSGVTFTRCSRRIHDPQYGMHHGHEYIGCDLARPASELRAIGSLMAGVHWVGETMVADGMLYVRSDYKVPFVLQERALHRVLDVARAVLAEGLAVIPTERLKPAPPVELNEDAYCSRANIYVQNESDPGRSSKYAVPAGCYEPTMMVVERNGHLQGHLLVPERYDDARRNLAVHLIDMLAPEAGVEVADRQFCKRIRLARCPEGMENLGAACLRMGEGMIAAMKDRVHKLQHEGRPSAFLDEDDDARDVLLGLMVGGATLTWSVDEGPDCDVSDGDPGVRYHLDDGSEAPYHVVQRLSEAGLIMPSDGRWGRSTTLIAAEGLTRQQLNPRAESVSFDMFQSACRFRRHPDDSQEECVSRSHHGYNSYCEAEACPLLDRVHENEYGDRICGRSSIDDDPAFDYHVRDERPDPLMVARHRNTMRSHAWRHAGENRMHGIVNRVLGAHLTYGIPMLIEAMHDAAVDQAVADGWIVVRERNPLGSVAEASDRLLAEVQRQRRQPASMDA